MTANEMLAKVHNLPPVSPAALELGSLLGSPRTSNEEVIRVLRQDSVLTAKLLRVCNSSALALRQSVGSVDHAVLILGHERISQIVAALSFRSPLGAPLAAYALAANELWRHSLLAASAAEIAVADGVDVGVDTSTAFTVGLLHDIGKLITNQFLTGQHLFDLRRCMEKGCSLEEAEREVMGTDHAEVGAGLAYLWRLPDQLVEAVALHHRPVLEPKPRLSALAAFASSVALHALADHDGREHPALDSEIATFKALGFGAEMLEVLLGRASKSSASTEQSLLAAA